ncbi:uncharacterized protein LOC110435855 [Sorghum bicolor]|uniref:uncharacterized protein LOC110435855 n=1 Tax=Sorghum bicolor TaxID=4558 RepID=UPI000B424206|nr:uncharacterized protein LOC110435855 [Sorghum bicolor]|eukprot:XP_021317610.1 uncharacterized protein LOC110435855 [Sorghum bicolor]
MAMQDGGSLVLAREWLVTHLSSIDRNTFAHFREPARLQHNGSIAAVNRLHRQVGSSPQSSSSSGCACLAAGHHRKSTCASTSCGGGADACRTPSASGPPTATGRPGLNLTCDTNHSPPRLLLGDGTLRVTAIFLANNTVRVVRAGPIINITGDLFTSDDGWNASLDFGRGFREHGYLLSSRNELVVFGCNVMATLSADVVGEETTKIVSGCASLYFLQKLYGKERYCTGTSRCCVASLISGGVPKAAQVRWLYSGNHTFEQTQEPVTVFVTPYGWIDDLAQWVDGFKEVPLLLEFGVKQGLPPALPQGSMHDGLHTRRATHGLQE